MGSDKMNIETDKRFQDVTDKISERTVDSEQKLSDANSNAAAQPVDLDLD